MIYSERGLKWLLNFYPPLLFTRIWIKSFSNGFRNAEVRISKSLLNMNFNKSIFGGTIFSAADPFYAIMYWQIFARKGIKVQSWLKSANIRYKKPGNTSLTLKFELTEKDISDAETALQTIGKFVRTFPVEVLDTEGDVCAVVDIEVYMRKIKDTQKVVSGF